METKSSHLFLFSLAFLLIGFLLGRVTAPQGAHGCQTKGPKQCTQNSNDEFKWVEEGNADVQVMMLADEDFDGDTAFTLPGGGKVNVVRNGDEYEVEVEMDEGIEGMEEVEKQVVVRKEELSDGSGVRVEKRVIVIKEEE